MMTILPRLPVRRGLWPWAFVGLLLVLLGVPARATHIVGGEMELVHRSGSTYTLVLNLYFDDINGNAAALDNQLTAGLFDKATNRCLTLRYTDPDPTYQLTVTARPVNFTAAALPFTGATSGTVRAAGAPDTLTATLCFPACLDSEGKV